MILTKDSETAQTLYLPQKLHCITSWEPLYHPSLHLFAMAPNNMQYDLHSHPKIITPDKPPTTKKTIHYFCTLITILKMLSGLTQPMLD